MNPDDPVIDLVERTFTNLAIIDELVSQRSTEYQPFEVTQLVNSLLSFLVVPRELGTVDFVGRSGTAPHVSGDGIRKWHREPVEFQLTPLEGKPPQHLKKLLGGLRNSVAHANFRLNSADGAAVSSIEFTSCSRARAPLWSVEFQLPELNKFLVNLGEELKAARSFQVSQRKRLTPVGEVPMSDVEFQLPTSTLARIQALVDAGGAGSVGRFLEEAAETRLRDDEEVAA